MSLPKYKQLNNGQALILVLLGMAVVLTLVLSIVSTSITDIDISTRDEEATRALSAAEAGVEQSFLLAVDSADTVGENSQYTAEVSGIAKGSTIYNTPKVVEAGATATLWYVSHNGNALTCNAGAGFPCVTNNNTSLKVCFGNNDDVQDAPAIEVSVYFDPNDQGVTSNNFSGVRVARAVFDPIGTRALANNFTQASDTNCDLDGVIYEYSADIANIASDLGLICTGRCLLMVKVKPVYNSSPVPVGFESGDLLPAQGIRVVSTGESGDSARRLEVFRSYKNLPAVFDNAVFSYNSLVK